MPKAGVVRLASATGLLLVLAAMAPPRNLAVEDLGDNRFRLTITYANTASPELHARMQIRLMEEAARLCRDRRRAVSERTLEVNEAPRGRIAVSEVYSCAAAAPSIAADPPR